jgi:hypothetical protein
MFSPYDDENPFAREDYLHELNTCNRREIEMLDAQAEDDFEDFQNQQNEIILSTLAMTAGISTCEDLPELAEDTQDEIPF